MSDDLDHWARVKDVLLAVHGAPEAERTSVLDHLTDGEPDLRASVDALLRASTEADTLPVPDVSTVRAWFGEPQDTRAAPMEPGRRFGAFRLLREIARGGMGLVYEAEQDEPRRSVALKVLGAHAASEEARARFQREARILGTLQHPGIAALYEAGAHETPTGERVPYLAMELVPGARGIVAYADAMRLGRDARLRLLLDATEAVSAGHQRGVIHRDIKPDNVLVDDDGRVKVVDFGIARMLDPEDGEHPITRTGLIVGTLGYMPPEQLAGDPLREDVRMDVYALGVLAYELLTGHKPLDIDASDVVEAARVVRDVPPTAPTRYVPDLPRDLVLILGKALAKEPDARYASVAAFAKDVTRYLASEPIEARAPSLTYQLRLFTRRHRTVVVAAACVVVALTLSTIFALDAAQKEREHARVARAAEQDARDASQRATGLLVGSQGLLYSLFDELYMDLAAVPGTLPARLALVERVEEGTRSLRVHARDDPEVLRLAGLVHMQVGLLNYRTGGDHLGRPTAALEAFEHSARAFALLAEATRSESTLNDRMHALLLRGHAADAHYATGNAAWALDEARAATTALRTLAERYDDAQLRAALAGQRVRLARLQRGLERSEDALATLRAALADVPSTTAHATRGHALALRGEIQRDAGLVDDARESFSDSLAAFETANRKRPDDPALDSRMGRIHGELGVLALRAQDGAAAEHHLTKALMHGRAQVTRNPTDRAARQSLQVDLARLSVLRSSQSRHEEALVHQAEAVAIARRLADDEPDAMVPRLELRISLNHLSMRQRAAGKLREAGRTIAEAHELATALLASHPKHPRVRLSHAEALDALAIVHWMSAREIATAEEKRALLVKAKALFEESLRGHEALAKDNLLPTTHQASIELLRKKVGICDQNLAALDGLSEDR